MFPIFVIDNSYICNFDKQIVSIDSFNNLLEWYLFIDECVLCGYE